MAEETVEETQGHRAQKPLFALPAESAGRAVKNNLVPSFDGSPPLSQRGLHIISIDCGGHQGL